MGKRKALSHQQDKPGSEREGRKLDPERVYRSPIQRFAHFAQKLRTKYRTRSRDRDVVLFLGRFIPEQGVVFDVGAHTGSYTKAFARLHEGRVEVHAFEPLAYNFSILEDVAAGHPNVHTNKVALSDQPGEVDLHLPVKESGRVGSSLGHFGPENARDYVIERVATTTLDAYVGERNLPRLDFVKCDVEGAEFLVLKGAAETLRRFHPTIYIEVFESYLARMGHAPKDVFGFLESLGYRAYLPDSAGTALRPVAGYEGPENYFFRA